MNSTGSWWALRSKRNRSPVVSPSASVIWRPSRATARVRVVGFCQSSARHLLAVGRGKGPSGPGRPRGLAGTAGAAAPGCCDAGQGRLGKRQQVLVDVVPVVPGHFVVLAVGIVIAVLGAADLVPPEDHGHPGGQQERAEEVAPLPVPELEDLGVVAVAFLAAVP